MRLPLKKLSSNAQQTLEYSLILALVAAGIILMGPYVIRSWNANLKSAEDSVIDSFNDPIIEDPDPGITIPGECNCDNFLTPDGCGGRFGAVTCAIDERAWIRDCTPDGCGEEEGWVMIECRADNSCCSLWTETNFCGSFAAHLIPPSGCADRVRAEQRDCPPGSGNYQYQCGTGDVACNIHCDATEISLLPEHSFVLCKDALKYGNLVDEHDEDVGPCPEIGSPACADRDYTFLEYDANDSTLGCTPDNTHKCEILCCPDWCLRE